MKYNEDGSVVAENAAECLQLLAQGYERIETPKLVGLALNGDSLHAIQKVFEHKGKYSDPILHLGAGQIFRRPEVKEPDWFGVETCIATVTWGTPCIKEWCGEVVEITPETKTKDLSTASRYCLKSDYDRWQSELAAQPKPYEPTEEEIELEAKNIFKAYQSVQEAPITWEELFEKGGTVNGLKAQARYVLQRIHEARQFALTAPTAPQKTEGLTLKELQGLPDGSLIRNGDDVVMQKDGGIWIHSGPILGEQNWRLVKKGGSDE